MRILSGIQPTGLIHLGNYFGALKQWLDLQNKNDCYFMVVDLHALTIPQDSIQFKKNIENAILDYLAIGLNPKKCALFVQSQVVGHTELAWILGTLTPLGELERMTQFKEKSEQHKESVNAGLFTYPILMAADILLYQADGVPVGKDQEQHIELTRTLVRKFNLHYPLSKNKVLFKEPATILPKEGAKILSLSDPSKKMSKSLGPDSYVAIFDKPEIIRKKIMSAITDSGKEIKFDLKEKPAISNLMTIYKLICGMDYSKIENKFSGKGYGDFKKDLAEKIIEFLKPIQNKRLKLEKDKKKILSQTLEFGRRKAQKEAYKTIKQVRKVVGLPEIK
jgi:tryptophanyl-tRNA synthetase